MFASGNLKRLLESLVGIFAAAILVFFIIHLVPGDPAHIILGEKATPEAIEAIRQQLGLDRPLYQQLLSYLGRLFQGDLGTSIRSGQSVMSEILARLPATIELSLVAMAIAVFFGILMGAFAALKPGSAFDLFLMSLSVLGLSLPIFFLGLVLIWIFGLQLEILPISGRADYSVTYTPITGLLLFDSLITGNFELFWSGLQHLILPAVALATIPLSMLARLTRASFIEVLRADFIRTARAKGASTRTIFLRHTMRNALLPVLTMAGFQFGLLMGGAILTENVFAWPGLGRWIVFSVEGRDYPAVQGAVLSFIVCIIVVMFLTESLQRLVDPRLRGLGR